jgi:hypothetical protein
MRGTRLFSWLPRVPDRIDLHPSERPQGSLRSYAPAFSMMRSMASRKTVRGSVSISPIQQSSCRWDTLRRAASSVYPPTKAAARLSVAA